MNENQRKILSVFLAVLVALSVTLVAPVSASAVGASAAGASVADVAEGLVEGDYIYTVENGVATIIRYTASADEAVVIPSEVGGYSVAVIGARAFFNHDELTSIVVPGTVKLIQDMAFESCDHIIDVTILSHDIELEPMCSLGEVYHTDYEGIWWYHLSIFTMHGYTGTGADTHCAEHRVNFVPLDRENHKDENLPFDYITFGGGAHITNYKASADEAVVIPAEVDGYPIRSIGDTAFYDNTALRSIVLPDTLEYIGTAAFCNCISLTDIQLPESVTYIGGNAFENCPSLKKVELPKGVTEMYNCVFAFCTSLEEMVIPEGITRIADGLFEGCTSLKKVTLPVSAQILAWDVFADCTSLTEVTIPEGVTNIGQRVFYNCPNIKEITIPQSVATIDQKALGYLKKEQGDRTIEYMGDFTIKGYYGTAAEEYANDNGFTFVGVAPATSDEVTLTAPEGFSYSVVDMRGRATADQATRDEASPDQATPDTAFVIPQGLTMLGCYDITLRDMDGNPVQPEVPVTVSIRCDEPDAKVYRRETDGTLTDMHAVYEDGCLVFTTDHFSLYIVATGAMVDLAVCGDADGDGTVTSIDVTYIRRWIAMMDIKIDEKTLMQGDVNGDGQLDVIDATWIQRYLAFMDTPYAIG